MAKSRKIVPPALHSELSEYSSLLRALRTTHTLDLSTHLTQPQQPDQDVDEGVDSDDGEEEVPPSEVVSREITPSRSSQTGSGVPVKQKSSGKGKARNRDIWTRWPLLVGDVHVPEWGLEDEIKILASHSLESGQLVQSIAAYPNIQDDRSDTNETVDNNAENPALTPSFLTSLTSASLEHLSQLLGALVAHVPLAEKSMQNRIKPMGKRNVLDIVSASGLVDANVLRRVQQRMEVVYGSSPSAVVPKNISAKQKLETMVSVHDPSLLMFPAAPGPKRKRGANRRKGESEAIKTEGDETSKEEKEASPRKRLRGKYKQKTAEGVAAATT